MQDILLETTLPSNPVNYKFPEEKIRKSFEEMGKVKEAQKKKQTKTFPATESGNVTFQFMILSVI